MHKDKIILSGTSIAFKKAASKAKEAFTETPAEGE